MIEARRRQHSFADGLIAEAVEDLWEPWMRHADKALEDEALLLLIQQELAKRCKKSKTRGRRATSAEVVLRMMLLKHIRDWSFEVLSREVRILPPSVKDGEKTDRRTQVFGIAGNGEQSLGGGLEQNVVERFLVVISDSGNLFRHGEHDMEVGSGQ
jgi:hypothetical protein